MPDHLLAIPLPPVLHPVPDHVRPSTLFFISEYPLGYFQGKSVLDWIYANCALLDLWKLYFIDFLTFKIGLNCVALKFMHLRSDKIVTYRKIMPNKLINHGKTMPLSASLTEIPTDNSDIL